jgi:hypothetical protein
MTDTLSPQKSKIAADEGNAHFVYDGGRGAVGFKGRTGDCVCRAIAIAIGKPYQEVYEALNALGSRERVGRRKRSKSSPRTGVYKVTKRRYLGRRSISRGAKLHSLMPRARSNEPRAAQSAFHPNLRVRPR